MWKITLSIKSHVYLHNIYVLVKQVFLDKWTIYMVFSQIFLKKRNSSVMASVTFSKAWKIFVLDSYILKERISFMLASQTFCETRTKSVLNSEILQRSEPILCSSHKLSKECTPLCAHFTDFLKVVNQFQVCRKNTKISAIMTQFKMHSVFIATTTTTNTVEKPLDFF